MLFKKEDIERRGFSCEIARVSFIWSCVIIMIKMRECEKYLFELLCELIIKEKNEKNENSVF